MTSIPQPRAPEYYRRERDPNKPPALSRYDRALLLLLIVGTILAVALLIIWT